MIDESKTFRLYFNTGANGRADHFGPVDEDSIYIQYSQLCPGHKPVDELEVGEMTRHEYVITTYVIVRVS